MTDRLKLHDYQYRALEHLERNKKSALFLSMGLGKTVITLTHIKNLLDSGRASKILIVAPLRVATSVWKQEAEKWQDFENISIGIATGPLKSRQAVIDEKHDIYVVNNENVVWLASQSISEGFDMIVIDESSMYKSNKTKRFKSMRQMTMNTPRVLILTGTPAPQSLLDLWSQIYLIDGGLRLYKHYMRYKTHYFTDVGYHYPNWIPHDDTLEKVSRKIQTIALTIKSSDVNVNDIDRIDTVETVRLPRNAMKIYEDVQKKFIASFEDGTLTAANAGVKIDKLAQIASGRVYDGERKVYDIHTEKIDRLKEIALSEYQGENILVACNYVHNQNLILDSIPDARLLKTDKDVSDWCEGKIRMLVTHPKSAGFGLNLQSGGSVIIWYGLTWSLTDYLQFNARLCRQGQTDVVRVVHLLASDTVDFNIYGLLRKREDSQERFMNRLIGDITR